MSTTNLSHAPLTAIVVDDEPLPRHHLRRQLELQGVGVLAEASGGLEALRLCADLHPDVVFLDIQMPGMDGMAIASALANLSVRPFLVFVTGYSEHGPSAFERDAVDYLLKPVSADRLLVTLTRLQERRAMARPVTAFPEPVPVVPPAEPLRHLPVRGDYAIVLLMLDEIVSVEARNKSVFVRTTGGHEYRAFHTLTQMETMLPEDRFYRVHDSHIVHLDQIHELNFLGSGSYAVSLKDERTVPVGRTRYAELRQRLHLP